MPTPDHIAASRAEQDQESVLRQPMTDAGEREADPHQTPLDDTSAPPDDPGPRGRDDDQDGDQGGPSGRPKPVNMSPSDVARAEIAKRFKRDAEEPVEFNGDMNDPAMLYGQHGRADQQQDEPPAPEPVHTIKVRGKELKLTTAELLERASKVEAADSYLAESRDLMEQAAKLRKDNRERAPDGHHRPDGRDNTQEDRTADGAADDPQHPEDDLEGAIEEVRYGTDSKEAAQRLRTAIAKEAVKVNSETQLKELRSKDNTLSQTALTSFIEANPDLAKDERSVRFMKGEIHDVQRAELIQLGVNEADLPANTDRLAEMHQHWRIHGHAVSSQQQLLDTAKSRLGSFRGEKPGHQPQPSRNPASPHVKVTVDRDARRAAMPSQPTRTMAPPPLQQQTQPATQDRSNVIANMRKARGQIVA